MPQLFVANRLCYSALPRRVPSHTRLEGPADAVRV